MYPTIHEFHLANGAVFGVHTYGLMILLAFCAAFGLVQYRAQQIGLHPDRLIAVYVAAAAGGIAGGRLLYAFALEPARTLAHPLSLFQFSGFALYGGIIGGAVAVGVVATALGVGAWKLADIAAPAVLIGIGVGRLGCFFAGCCHGAPAPIGPDPVGLLPDGLLGGQIWLSGTFPFVTTQFDGGVGRLLHEPLYPTQLWSVAAGVGLCVLTQVFWKYRRFDGQVAGLVLVIEPITRFLIESFRADERGYAFQFPVIAPIAKFLPGLTEAGDQLGGAMMGVTTSQAIGFFFAVPLGILILVARRKAGVAPEIPVSEQEDVDLPATA